MSEGCDLAAKFNVLEINWYGILMSHLCCVITVALILSGNDIVRNSPAQFSNLNLGQEVTGATLGIIGMGSIGYKVAQKANGFNMAIHYNNRNQRYESSVATSIY